MHTWTVTCDPAVTQESGTAATEVDAVGAGADAMRRLLRATHQPGQDSPFVQLSIDTRPRIGITVGAGGPDTVFEWLDDYAHQATLAAAVNDSILGRTHLEAS